MACRAIKSEEIQITELPKEVILMVNLPNCPRGESFVLAIDESCYYNPLTEDDMRGNIKQYMFLPNEVLSNNDFFFRGSKDIWLHHDRASAFNEIYGASPSHRRRFLNE